MTSQKNDDFPDKKSIFTRTIIDIKELDKVLKKGSNHGVCGGHNLGNTCFMNSSIACLSNCTELTTYFLTGKYKSDINTKNKEGLGGKLASAWHSLLEEYWNSGAHAGNPSEVKSTVAKKARKFYGFSQQDSNEFMAEFLSILNEDLNKTSKKEYKELKEKQDDEKELDCAKRFWNLHVKLNDSIITDLFSGLFKSEVECTNPKCCYKNITFDAFNTLTLPIPTYKDLYFKHKIFYIPKYSINKNCIFEIIIKKNSSLKEIIEKIKNIKEFNYKLNKLKYIKVVDTKLECFTDENGTIKKPNDFIFVFDDLSKEEEKTSIIPLYFYKEDKISSFPRLLFLEQNINFEQLKRKIFYYARNCFSNPFKEDKNEVDEELKKYKEQNDKYDEQKLWNLFDKEYEEIFKNEQNKEKLKDFFEDFPYKIIIKKKFEDKENICIFDGKNNLENLKEFEITKDEDLINNLLDKIKNNDYCINFILSGKSSFTDIKLNFNSGQSYAAKTEIEKGNMNLDELLTYFSDCEHLAKGNEWRCGKCKEKVEATKKLSIYYVPRLLIICLSRFKRSGDRYYEKNGELIDFPLENLDMGKYISGPDKDNSIYDLFAVSQHFGGCGGGHYTAVCKNIDGNWYDYNDSSCSKDSSRSVVSSSAYVLFYRRRTW